jgi:hypothetical protein
MGSGPDPRKNIKVIESRGEAITGADGSLRINCLDGGVAATSWTRPGTLIPAPGALRVNTEGVGLLSEARVVAILDGSEAERLHSCIEQGYSYGGVLEMEGDQHVVRFWNT